MRRDELYLVDIIEAAVAATGFVQDVDETAPAALTTGHIALGADVLAVSPSRRDRGRAQSHSEAEQER